MRAAASAAMGITVVGANVWISPAINEAHKSCKALLKITTYLLFGLVKREMKTNWTVRLGSPLRLV